jgi:ATP-dependent helicase/nuclease subunit B
MDIADPVLPRLDAAALHALIDEAGAAELVVVTPNLRLARALIESHDRHQVDSGLRAWEAPDILSWPAFLGRLYEEALYAGEEREGEAGPPAAIATPEQELAIWEQQIRRAKRGQALVAVPETAELARDAWGLAHAWQLVPVLAHAGLDDDAAAFAEWAEGYGARMRRERLADRARLPELIAGLLGEGVIRAPGRVVAWGFDLYTPQQRALFAALEAGGSRLLSGPAQEARSRPPVRVACADTDAELRLAARWARARLEAPAVAPVRVGIVIPDLAGERARARRVLREVLAPAAALPGVDAPLPFDVTLGEPLSAVPLVRHALDLLELAGREIDFERISLLLRSPYIAGASAECEARALLDAALRRRARPMLAIEGLLQLMQGRAGVAPMLEQRIEALAEMRKTRLFAPRPPREWSIAFVEALDAAGFAGDRPLDSAEFQARAKWHEVLGQFARLDRVLPAIGYQEALGRLARIASDCEFQPESRGATLQVLGVLEAAGMRFDHLWVTGLSEEAWPLHPKVNPFLPFAAQRAAGVPNASPAETLALARRLTSGWLAAAPEVVLSHPLAAADRALRPSALIRDLPEGMPSGVPDYPLWQDEIRLAASLERTADAGLPAFDPRVRGAGVALLRDQAACPFRAYARHRLGARPLDAAHAGLDPAERGMLVHAVLARAWEELGDSARLASVGESELGQIAQRAAEQALASLIGAGSALLRTRFAEVERDRLTRLALVWFAFERSRRADGPAFRIAALEAPREVDIAGLKLSVRIDRVDETEAGERLVIDYKTGTATLPGVLKNRMDEPQLPLYLCFAEPGASALAFAQVRAGEMKFVGLAETPGRFAGLPSPATANRRSGAQPDWPAQLAFWRRELEQLAEDYLAGRAGADPKKGSATCRECELQTFCRIGAQETDGAEEPDAGDG